MKKQITLVSAIAAVLMSTSLFAGTIVSAADTVGSVDHDGDRTNTLTGGAAQYVTDDYTFNLSSGVSFKMIQDATGIAAVAATLKGSGAAFGGSTSGTIQECGGEISEATTAAPGAPTVADGCAGTSS